MRTLICVASFSQVLACALLGKAEEPTSVLLPKLGDICFKLAGNDLSGMTTWLEATQHEDPDNVFSMQGGVLRASDGGMGYIATKQRFREYHLQFEYRWGELRKPSKYVHNSGVMLHCHGVDGSAGGRWISSIECQLAQGCEGDLILIRGKSEEGSPATNTLWSHIKHGKDGRPRWNPAGEPTKYTGRQFWWNRHQESFKELVDTRGDHDVASRLGEWTKVEVFSFDKQLAIRVNDQLVNHGYDVQPAGGRIAFQCEGYEVLFRNVQVRKLKFD